jgi:hypothetical protein
MFRLHSVTFLLPVFLLVLASCKKKEENPTPADDNELITTLTLTLTKIGNSVPFSIVFTDPDGAGGQVATLSPSSLTLDANAIYNGTLKLEDASKNPSSDITVEIKKEDIDHQFFYTVSKANLMVNNLNKDAKNQPLGITSTFTTGVASSGTLTVTLKHKPGQKGANDAITVGSTDIEVVFPVTVE